MDKYLGVELHACPVLLYPALEAAVVSPELHHGDREVVHPLLLVVVNPKDRYIDNSIDRYIDNSIDRYIDNSISRYIDNSINRYIDNSIDRKIDYEKFFIIFLLFFTLIVKKEAWNDNKRTGGRQ